MFLEELRGVVGLSACILGTSAGLSFHGQMLMEARVCLGGVGVGVCLNPIGHQTAGHVGDHTCVLLTRPGQQFTPPGNMSLALYIPCGLLHLTLALWDLRSCPSLQQGSLEVLVFYPPHPCPPRPRALPPALT